MGGKRTQKRLKRTQKRLKRTQKRLKRTQKRLKRTQKRYKKRINKTNKRGGAFYHKFSDRKDVNCYIADIFKKFIDRERKKDISERRVPVLPEFTTYTDIYSLYNIIYNSQKYREYLGIDETKWLNKYKDKLRTDITKIRNIFRDEGLVILTDNIQTVITQEPELEWNIQDGEKETLYNVDFIIPPWLKNNYGNIENTTGYKMLDVSLNILKYLLDDFCGLRGYKNTIQYKKVYGMEAPGNIDTIISSYQRDKYVSIFFTQRM